MRLKTIERLLDVVERHQVRLAKTYELLEDCGKASPSASASVLTQILDLATSSTYLLTNEICPATHQIMGDSGATMNYTFSPEQLDAEMGDCYIEEDEDDEDPVR